MTLEVTKQDSYSRVELLLRSFFGTIYITIPHMFLLMFLSLWSGILTIISWWIIMFTGSYPESFYTFQVDLIRWQTRVNLRLYNLSDGYPAFGLTAEDEAFKLDIPYPDTMNRALQLVKLFFGALYVGIPHGFLLIFRSLATLVLMFLAWWMVLFTGSYPASWHDFNVGTLRWSLRVNLYLKFMSDEYPPFSGK